jgi:hypothetical protein
MIGRFFLFFLCLALSFLLPIGLLFLPGSVGNGHLFWMNPLASLQ